MFSKFRMDIFRVLGIFVRMLQSVVTEYKQMRLLWLYKVQFPVKPALSTSLFGFRTL